MQRLDKEDPIFRNDATIIAVRQDLLILENQIPFLVLERLFPLTLARLHNNLSLTDYVVDVFLPLVDQLMRPAKGQSADSTGSEKTSRWPRDCILWVSGNKINNSKPEEEVSSGSNVNYYHILHKLHHYVRPQDLTKEWGGLYLPSASELVHAGVKFVPATGNDLFKVKFTEPEGQFWWFRSARFEIPPLEVDDGIELFLRNFIAFEQCCPGISQYFTSYAYLMERLMESDKDVQVLDNAGVIHNKFGAQEDALDIFDKLLKEVTISEFCFADACNRATMYGKRFWPKNMAYMRSQRSQFIAFCLGFVAFGVSIAQLIVGIYSIK